MNNALVYGLVAGMIAGIIVGVSIRLFGPIDQMIPDNFNALITGGVAGAVTVLVYSAKNKKNGGT